MVTRFLYRALHLYVADLEQGWPHRLVDYAMWCGAIPVGTNPMSLVTVRGSSKRMKQPRSLTVEEFHTLSKHLKEPFKTMALLQLCLGLRVSELLALRWKDVDWIGSKLNVEHGIVNQACRGTYQNTWRTRSPPASNYEW